MTKPIKKIVAIGGGDVRNLNTLPIDAEILRLTDNERPKILFVMTASSDNRDYADRLSLYFSNHFSCETETLLLLAKPSSEEIASKILSADVIYVGGGNTLKMMKIWRKLGVDKLLEAAWHKGTVLCGISAGSICWFESGHSDAMSFYRPDQWEYIQVRGLGLLQGVHCPHFDSHTLGLPRKVHFERMMQKIGKVGFAIDDSCAMVFLDETYRVIAATETARAYKLYKKKGKVVTEEIPLTSDQRPVRFLLER